MVNLGAGGWFSLSSIFFPTRGPSLRKESGRGEKDSVADGGGESETKKQQADFGFLGMEQRTKGRLLETRRRRGESTSDSNYQLPLSLVLLLSSGLGNLSWFILVLGGPLSCFPGPPQMESNYAVTSLPLLSSFHGIHNQIPNLYTTPISPARFTRNLEFIEGMMNCISPSSSLSPFPSHIESSP